MTRLVHGAPAAALREALKTLARLAFWIAWTVDPDAPVGARGPREAARRLDDAAYRHEAFDCNAIDA